MQSFICRSGGRIAAAALAVAGLAPWAVPAARADSGVELPPRPVAAKTPVESGSVLAAVLSAQGSDSLLSELSFEDPQQARASLKQLLDDETSSTVDGRDDTPTRQR